MGDFPQQWGWLRDLGEGGQGHTYVVKRSDGSDSADYVLKRLKNAKRKEYFEREIQACERLNHPSNAQNCGPWRHSQGEAISDNAVLRRRFARETRSSRDRSRDCAFSSRFVPVWLTHTTPVSIILILSRPTSL